MPRWFFGLVRLRMRYISERTLLIVLTVLTGIAAGVATWLLRVLIDFVTHHLLRLIDTSGFNPLFILFPVVGLLLAVMFQRHVVHDNMNHSEARLRDAFGKGNYRLNPHLLWAPLAACPVTLGFGGSAGSEGPAAVLGAAAGSNLGRLLGCDGAMLRCIVACGSGAGIAGIFTAPIAGVMFAVEVLRIELTTLAILLLFISCICAATTSYILSGSSLNLTFFVDQPPRSICSGSSSSSVWSAVSTAATTHFWCISRIFGSGRFRDCGAQSPQDWLSESSSSCSLRFTAKATA